MLNRKYKVLIYFVGLGIQEEFYFSKGLSLKQNIELARILIMRNKMYYISKEYTVYYRVDNKLKKLNPQNKEITLEFCSELYLF